MAAGSTASLTGKTYIQPLWIVVILVLLPLVMNRYCGAIIHTPQTADSLTMPSIVLGPSQRWGWTSLGRSIAITRNWVKQLTLSRTPWAASSPGPHSRAYNAATLVFHHTFMSRTSSR